MPSGFITSHINVAQLVLYAFWIFFAFLVIYLRREDKREGYPLESDRSERSSRVKVVGFPLPPEPKTYLLRDNQGSVQLPKPPPPPSSLPAGTELKAAWPGAPLVPTGDPMRDGVGPASCSARENVPDLAITGKPKIVPMRVATDFHVEPTDPDPRGMAVVAADGGFVGTVAELWVDRAEPRILYFEVALEAPEDAETENAALNNVLLPYGFARVDFGRGRINVSSIMSHQFAHVPRTESDEQITRLEEDRICAYFASGHLYAHPSRQRPLI